MLFLSTLSKLLLKPICIFSCGTKIHREHKTVLINIVFINAYLQLFDELYDKTCIYFLYVYYVLHVLVTILLQSANQINASASWNALKRYK